eukprot:1107877-Rhodomonas_salina.4
MQRSTTLLHCTECRVRSDLEDPEESELEEEEEAQSVKPLIPRHDQPCPPATRSCPISSGFLGTHPTVQSR